MNTNPKQQETMQQTEQMQALSDPVLDAVTGGYRYPSGYIEPNPPSRRMVNGKLDNADAGKP